MPEFQMTNNENDGMCMGLKNLKFQFQASDAQACYVLSVN